MGGEPDTVSGLHPALRGRDAGEANRRLLTKTGSRIGFCCRPFRGLGSYRWKEHSLLSQKR